MTLPKLLTYLGIALIVYGIVSGFYFHFSYNSSGYSESSGYTFKLGTVAVGIVLIYLSRRLNASQ